MGVVATSRDHTPTREGTMTAPTTDSPSVTRRYLRPREAAAYLGVTKATLDAWRSRGQGPRYRKPSASVVIYEVPDLDAWISDQPLIEPSA